MSKELEYIQRENSSFRSNEERLRHEILNLEKQRDSFREKYQEFKSKNTLLNTKVSEIESEIKNIMAEKQNEVFDKKKVDELKKGKVETKQKVLKI